MLNAPQRHREHRTAAAYHEPRGSRRSGLRHLATGRKLRREPRPSRRTCCATIRRRGLLPAQHSRPRCQRLETAADIDSITLYAWGSHLRHVPLLRYGRPVQIAVGQAHEDGAPDRLTPGEETTSH